MTHYNYNPDGSDDYIGLGGTLKPVPCSDRALKLAAAVLGVVNTQRELEEAYDRVPNYTAQHSTEDYYAVEQDKFYRACERLERVIDAPHVLYEVGDYVELTPRRLKPSKDSPVLRSFGIVDSIDDDGYYTIKLIGERGLVTDKTVRVGYGSIKGLSDRNQHYAAHTAKELLPVA